MSSGKCPAPNATSTGALRRVTTTPPLWDDLVIRPRATGRGVTLNPFDQLSFYRPERPAAYHHEQRVLDAVAVLAVGADLRMHLAEPLREFIADHADRLTACQLPSHSPDLNPREGIWSLVKRAVGSLAAADLGQLARAVKGKRRLEQIQYRPDLVDGSLAGTGLITHG